MGRCRLLVLFLGVFLVPLPLFAEVAPYLFEPKQSTCPAVLAEAVPVDVWWRPVQGDAEPSPLRMAGSLLQSFLRDAADRDDVLLVLQFRGVEGAEAAARLFNAIVSSAGMGVGEEDTFGAGIATTGSDGFVQGVYRDAEGQFVSGRENAARVRALDLILSPATPAQRAALLGAIRSR